MLSSLLADALIPMIFADPLIPMLFAVRYVKDQFWEYVQKEAVRRDLKVLIKERARFVLVHTHSGYKHALDEVLSEPVCIVCCVEPVCIVCCRSRAVTAGMYCMLSEPVHYIVFCSHHTYCIVFCSQNTYLWYIRCSP
jgi:hypothetical protein